MAYSTELEAMWLENLPATPTVEAAILLMEGGLPALETERVSVAAPNLSRGPLVFPAWDADYWAGRGTFCLVVQDSNGGLLFRSNWVEVLPAGAPGNMGGLVNFLAPEVQRLTIEELNTQLATRVAAGAFNAPPADPSLIVTSATLTLNSGSLTLNTIGTRSTGGFTFTTSFTIEPVGFPFYGPPITTRRVGTPSITFTAGTGHGLETFLLNLFSGGIANDASETVLRRISSGLNDQARTEVAKLAGVAPDASGAQVLPEGISVELRRCVITPSGVGGQGPGIYLWASVCSFGSLIERLRPAGSPGGSSSKCALGSLVPIGLLAAGALPLFRAARDERLSRTRDGQRIIELYYRHAQEVAVLVEDRPDLATEAGAIAAAVMAHLSDRSPASADTVRRIEDFLMRIAPISSRSLQEDISRVLAGECGHWPPPI